MLDSTAEAIYGLDTSGNCTFCNPASLRMLGYENEQDLLGQNVHDLIHHTRTDGSLYDSESCEICKFNRIGEEIHIENQIIWRADETSFQAEYWSHPINRDGKVVGSVVTFIDITERKRSENAVKEARARLVEIIDIAPEAIISIGSDMKIQLFNQGAERIFGYKAKEMMGQPMDILIPEDMRHDHSRHIEGFSKSSATYRLMDQRDEVMGRRKDGSSFPASASVSKLQIDGETVFTVMLLDSSERRKAEKDLRRALNAAEEANRAKSDFMASMSHELRSPNSIMGFAEMISHQSLGSIGNEKYLQYANYISLSGNHLLELINQILDIERIEAGKYILDKEEFDVEDLIDDCRMLFEQRAIEEEIILSFSLANELPYLLADKRVIKQILINIITNALKFTPQGGQVDVRAFISRNKYVFEICDTGLGIPEDKLDTIKDPFTRHESDPLKPQDGVGLGLSIANAFAGLHNGTLEISSEFKKGTTVTIELPADCIVTSQRKTG